MSVDGINSLVVDAIGQLSRDVIGRLSVYPSRSKVCICLVKYDQPPQRPECLYYLLTLHKSHDSEDDFRLGCRNVSLWYPSTVHLGTTLTRQYFT